MDGKEVSEFYIDHDNVTVVIRTSHNESKELADQELVQIMEATIMCIQENIKKIKRKKYGKN